MAAIFLGLGPSPSIQTPGYASTLVAPGSPRSASVAITICSRRCTWAGPDAGSSGTSHDRVGDQLAGPVVGDVAAAIGALERRTHQRRVDQHVPFVRMGPERVGVRVLQEQEVVVPGPRGQRVLQHVRLVVRNRPERPDAQHGRRPQSSAAQSRLLRSSEIRARNSDT